MGQRDAKGIMWHCCIVGDGLRPAEEIGRACAIIAGGYSRGGKDRNRAFGPHLGILWRGRCGLGRRLPFLGHRSRVGAWRSADAADESIACSRSSQDSRGRSKGTVAVALAGSCGRYCRAISWEGLDGRPSVAMIVAKMSRSRALGWSVKGLLPLALPATVVVITLVSRRRRRKPTAAAPAGDAAVSVPEQVGDNRR